MNPLRSLRLCGELIGNDIEADQRNSGCHFHGDLHINERKKSALICVNQRQEK